VEAGAEDFQRGGQRDRRVSADLLLRQMVEQWEVVQSQFGEQLRTLFRQADKARDGRVPFSKFRDVLHKLEPGCAEVRCARLYLASCDADGVQTAESFSSTLRDNGVSALRPAAGPPDEAPGFATEDGDDTEFHALLLDRKLESLNEKLAQEDGKLTDLAQLLVRHIDDRPMTLPTLSSLFDGIMLAKNNAIAALQKDLMRVTNARDERRYTYRPGGSLGSNEAIQRSLEG